MLTPTITLSNFTVNTTEFWNYTTFNVATLSIIILALIIVFGTLVSLDALSEFYWVTSIVGGALITSLIGTIVYAVVNNDNTGQVLDDFKNHHRVELFHQSEKEGEYASLSNTKFLEAISSENAIIEVLVKDDTDSFHRDVYLFSIEDETNSDHTRIFLGELNDEYSLQEFNETVEFKKFMPTNEADENTVISVNTNYFDLKIDD